MTAQLNLLRHLLKLYNQDQTKGKVHKRTHTGGRPLNHRGGQLLKKTSTSNCTRYGKSSPSKFQFPGHERICQKCEKRRHYQT